MRLDRRVRALEQRQQRRTAELDALVKRELKRLGLTDEELGLTKPLDLTPEQAAQELAALLGVSVEDLPFRRPTAAGWSR